MKKTLRYDHGIARLEIEGLPDISLGQTNEVLGIILSWKINLIGFPQLEGKKEHLELFIIIISQYARHYISGVRKAFGSSNSLISITPLKNKHEVSLRSTREGVKPLKIVLDDADLVDLTKCFDQLRSDPKVVIDWKIPIEKPLQRGELGLNIKIIKSFFFPFLGVVTSFLTAFLLLLVPIETIETPLFESSPQSRTRD